VVKAMKAGCVAMCSTDPGAYGNPVKGTEVPRTPLLAALMEKSQNRLARSDQVAVGSHAATADLPALGAPFKSEVAGTIDYWI
jgi:hypothetical protein